jgi:hypothetical protein
MRRSISSTRMTPGTGKDVPGRPEPNRKREVADRDQQQRDAHEGGPQGALDAALEVARPRLRSWFQTTQAAAMRMPSSRVELFMPVAAGPHSGR